MGGKNFRGTKMSRKKYLLEKLFVKKKFGGRKIRMKKIFIKSFMKEYFWAHGTDGRTDLTIEIAKFFSKI